MAKSLKNPPPSSSVARLLDATAASRAIGNRSNQTQASGAPEQCPHRGEASEYVKREFVLTSELDEAFVNVTRLVRHCTGARVTNSHVARSLIMAMNHCEDALKRELTDVGRLRLPSNAKGNEEARREFEMRIASALLSGMRAAPGLRVKRAS